VIQQKTGTQNAAKKPASRSVQKTAAPKAGAPQKALDDQTPARTLSIAYIAALGFIAILTIASHIITAHITNKQKEGADIAFKIGAQRAGIHEIIQSADKYYSLGDPLDLDFLNQSIAKMEKGQSFLTDTIRQSDLLGNPVSSELQKIYFQQPYALDEKTTWFLTWAKELATLPKSESARRQIAFDYVANKLPATLAIGLDVALQNYQTEAQAKTDYYYDLQYYGALFVLLVLALEAIFIFRPLVARVENYHQMLLRYALEDYLTGLNNRRAFMKRATTELRRAQREGSEVVVVLSDLDKFKSVNDTYGHKVGDLVLQHYAEQLQSLLRSGDIIGRIGGEEFAILLPRTSAEMGFQTIDRLREKIARLPCPYVDADGKAQILSYSSSFGMVAVCNSAEGIDALLARADEGLYEAKARGRNCVVQVPESPADGTAGAQAAAQPVTLGQMESQIGLQR
jgi:diguanylate cyclase (GGDEF)-like protein